MTQLDMVANGASEESPRLDAVGWRKVANAVNSMRQLSMPMLLTIVSSRMAPLWIDCSR